jgi:ADP-L-glycero-D-manno-heptose 6-epimerase
MDMPEELRGKYQYFTEANMNKLRSVGYSKNMTSLEDGVRDYVERFMSREDQYK